MGLSSDPELSCGRSSERSRPRLCCWPQQCAFVGGDRSWPQQLTLGSGQGRVASLHVHLWLGLHTRPLEGRAQPAARGPVLLVCTTVSPLPSVPPHWAAWQICSLTGSARVAALAQLRWLVGCVGAQRCHRELLRGSVAGPAPRSPLSCHTACGLLTPRGTWLGLSHIPLQLQPALSKFLCLMQGGETTQVSKGRAHGALSCWADGRLFL